MRIEKNEEVEVKNNSVGIITPMGDGVGDIDNHRHIILSSRIDNDTYQQILRGLSHASRNYPESRIRIYINGYGGSVESTRAIVDIIQEYEKVDGILTGEAYSAHSIIWAACPSRWIYPSAVLGVHPVWGLAIGTGKDLEKESKHMEQIMQWMAGIYAAASNKTSDWWYKKMYKAGDSLIYLYANNLLTMKMGKPKSELKIVR